MVGYSMVARWTLFGFYGGYRRATTSLYVYDSDQDTVKRLSENKYQAVAPFWSPDGQRIVFEEVSNFHGWFTE